MVIQPDMKMREDFMFLGNYTLSIIKHLLEFQRSLTPESSVSVQSSHMQELLYLEQH